jgi:ABC-type Fe3+-siderophore transport system permease subunit
VSAAVVVGYLYLTPPSAGGFVWIIVVAVLGAFAGAFIGVRFTRSMGWRFPLAWGALAGVVGSALFVALSAGMLGA